MLSMGAQKMTFNTPIIIAISFALAILLLVRVAFQIHKRKSIFDRYQRTPSSATISTLSLDSAVAIFLIAVAVALIAVAVAMT